IYPVFFAQSSLAQVDLPAAGLTFWGLEAYLRKRSAAMAVWFSLAVLAKETAVLGPLALLAQEAWVRSYTKRLARSSSVGLANGAVVGMAEEQRSAGCRATDARSRRGLESSEGHKLVVPLLLVPVLTLAAWYRYHYARTGFVFGNPEFFRYNVQATLHPL